MMRENQTMEYVKRMHARFCWFDTEGNPVKREPHGMMEICEPYAHTQRAPRHWIGMVLREVCAVNIRGGVRGAG